MKDFIVFPNITPDIIISNEEYYNIPKFLNRLSSGSFHFKKMNVCYLVPFYIQDGKRLEIYDYQFKLDTKSSLDINGYILAVSNKKCLEEVEPRFIEKLKHCYFTNIETFFQDMKSWMNYVINDKDLITKLETAYGKYDSNNMYFDIFVEE